MKLAILPVVFVFACSAAWAQQAPAPKKPQTKASAGEKVASGKKSRRSEDARHCLDEGSNAKIIKCAEAYL